MPQKFNYQGIARDAKGNPLAHQRMTLKLTLLPTSDATEGEYEEIQTVMTNEFGLYTLQIGNGASTSLSTFKDIKWETGKKYIRVAIDPKGGSDFVDAGTNQLLSVPYAIYADKAGMAKNAGGDRTGTVSTNATHVSGDTNFLAKFTGLNVIGKSQLFDNGTNVGVGTTSPLFKLHIQKPTGNADILVRTLDSTGAASLRLRNSAGAELGINKFGPNATGNFMGIPRANMAAVNNFTTGPFVFNSGSDIVFGNTVGPTQIPRMFVSGATGNVGIGTLTPSAKLEVAGQLKITGGNPAVGKILTSDSNGLASWQTSITDSQWASNGTHIFNNNSGNVGIGTNTPSSQLHLASPIAEIRLQNTAINTSLFITAPFNGGTGGIGTDGNHELPFFTNNIERMVIKNDGRMGIGTNVPNARLHVADSAVVFSAIGDTAIATFNNKPPIEGAGRRMMWYPERGAFRAGGVAGIDSVNWNRDNIGAYSVAMGWNTQAKGRSSFASGDNTTASGFASTAMGESTTASGDNSTGMGESTEASGSHSTAMGLFTEASGDLSTAMGESTEASGDNSTAMGVFTAASGEASTAMGISTIASGDLSTAMGSSTTASGKGSTAMGRLTKAAGDRSTVTGIHTQANGFASLVIGQFNDTVVAPQTAMSSTTPLFIIGNGTDSNALSNVMVARNDGRVGIGSSAPVARLHVADSAVVFARGGTPGNASTPVVGDGVRMMWLPDKAAFRVGEIDNSSQAWHPDSIGQHSVAMGRNTQAKGLRSVAMGNITQANGDNSTAMGSGTTANGVNSTAMGNGNVSNGNQSTTMGSGTTANGDNSTAMGAFTFANGTRSTAMGSNSIANGFSSLVIGRNNDTLLAAETAMSSTTPLFIIGNGSSSSARSNVLVARNDGRVGIGSSAPASTLETGASFGAAITTTSTNLTLTEAHHTVIITGGTPSLTLPSPTAVNRRINILVNHTATNRTVSSYFNLSGAVTSTIPPTSSITIQSNGSNWYQIR